jgi:hypothetical protein
MFLAREPRTRDSVLAELSMGLRTFYRELELLHRCGVKVSHKNKAYCLQATAAEAEGRLPFPDPLLSFAEMAELSRHPGEASLRLAQLLDSVVNYPLAARRGRRERKGTKG